MLANPTGLPVLLPFLAKNLHFLNSATLSLAEFLLFTLCSVQTGCRLSNTKSGKNGNSASVRAHEFDSPLPNLENYATVEFRLFRGTLRYKTFIAALQLVDEICRCAINMTDNETESMSWSDFVRCIPPAKHELIQYLKSKQLYVNDTVTESEEM